MKKLFLILAILTTFAFAGVVNSQTYLAINTDVVTSTNDTIVSGWYNIANYKDVSLFFNIGDSVAYLGRVDFQTGSTSYYDSYTLAGNDTLNNLASPTYKGKGVSLRGNGYVTDKIPGASYIRITIIRQTWSTAHTSAGNKCYIVFRD